MRALLIAALLPCSGPALAAGNSGADFLRINTSPRAAGMGESGVALADDALSALSLNPAGLARLNFAEAGFSYNRWVEDVSLQSLSLAVPTKKWGAFGLGATMLRVEPFPGYDNSGARAGDVTTRDAAYKAAYALRVLGPDNDLRYGLFAGGALKRVEQRLDTVSASAAMADAGVIAAWPLGRGVGSAGYSASSLGSGLRFDAERDRAPTVQRFGAAYALPLLGDPFTVSADLRKPVDDGASFGVGLEYAVKRLLLWRLGYTTEQDLGSGFRFGIGFRLKVVTVDYGLSHVGRFGPTHQMALSVRFGEPIERLPVTTPNEEKAIQHIARGRRLAMEGRHYEAALEFNEALRLDPGNREAIKLLRSTRALMEQLK